MDPGVVLQQWQDLASRDPRCTYRQLVDEEANKNLVLTFRGSDDTTAIEAVSEVGRLRIFLVSAMAHSFPLPSASKVLAGGRLADGPKFHALQLTRRLAGEMVLTNPPLDARKSKRKRSEILPILLPRNGLNIVNQALQVMRCRNCTTF